MKLSHLALSMLVCAHALAVEKTIIVAADGSGDFKTVQEALSVVPDNSADRTIIQIKPGTYEGPFVITKFKTNVTLLGEDAKTTTLNWPHNVKGPKYDEKEGFNPGLLVKAADFRAENLTIANTSGEWGQGLAAKVDGDRAVFKNCRLTGWQDTLMVNDGRSYFSNCHIEGRVDFIYGNGTSVFDKCEILSKNGGYVTAASTPQDKSFGFVFLDCKLIGDPTPWNPTTTNPATTQQARKPGMKTELGRPWRPYAAVAFVRCDLGEHIIPTGWNNWRKEENEKTARFSEYKNTGPGADPGGRVKWAKQLTDEEAAKYTIPNILGGKDAWDPTAEK